MGVELYMYIYEIVIKITKNPDNQQSVIFHTPCTIGTHLHVQKHSISCLSLYLHNIIMQHTCNVCGGDTMSAAKLILCVCII